VECEMKQLETDKSREEKLTRKSWLCETREHEEEKPSGTHQRSFQQNFRITVKLARQTQLYSTRKMKVDL
jgi:hypothetical protein